MSRAFLVFSLLVSLPAASAAAAERVVQKLSVEAEPGRRVELQLVRASDGDGGLTVKLVAKSGGKPQSLVVYEGGGGDEGPGDADVVSLRAEPFDFGGGKKGVRVDFAHRLPEGKRSDEETESTLVSLQKGVKRLLTQRTRRLSERSKLCREGEETVFRVEDRDGPVLVATTQRTVDPTLGDDDLPVDKNCRAPGGGVRKVFRLVDDRLVEDPLAAGKAPSRPEPPRPAPEKRPPPPVETDDD